MLPSNVPLWTPSQELIEQSNLQEYTKWLADTGDLRFKDYHALWQWSVTNTDQFWESILRYFALDYDGVYASVTNGMPMPETRWFEGIALSYAENVFKRRSPSRPAIIFRSESGTRKETSWQELTEDVSSLQHQFRVFGIEAGDRIVAFMPGDAEATTAFLAANALGAVWSCCSPDFGISAVIERFSQIEPKILIATLNYNYGGKTFDRTTILGEIVGALPSLEALILVADEPMAQVFTVKTVYWKDALNHKNASLDFVRVPFSHPIWILYSSGTTGIPKAIVHSQGGILLEHLKYGAFHNDFREGEKCFWFTTTGWMMWNYIHGCLLAGCTLVLYDGSPSYPDLTVLWNMAGEEELQHFGTSASFITANMNQGIAPAQISRFESLRSISATGSTLPAEAFLWIYQNIKSDVWLVSMSGGTDVCSAFVGGNPTWPVFAGEIQCRALGCKLEALDEMGHPVIDQVGEMVIEKPMPSMPVFFWNDINKQRYRESYFELYPGLWRHGDWIRITTNNGVVVLGRSDATLNRGGVRIGTSEVYSALNTVRQVKDALIVCLERSGGKFWMPLFVMMQDGVQLTDAVKEQINKTLRTTYSPRHVPDDIISVPDIPYTLSGKKSELAVKKILLGIVPSRAVNTGVLKNPGSLNFFINMATGLRP